MPKKSKKFIDKKNSVTFHLVHRSQQDPLIADENAPQRVLVPVAEKPKSDANKHKEEEQKYGIYFDDDYDYLQHLRNANNTMEWEKVESQASSTKTEPNIQLPSSVFASEVEEEVGLLNKAAPQGLRLDVDPDIVAAMDDDFDYNDPDNLLDDNFMDMANAECSDDDDYEDEEENSDIDSNFADDDSEAMDDVASLDGPQFTFKDEETKSRFTDYSMSSSVMRRNEQLTLLDDRFEKMYAGYDENEIGALDCDEIEGHVPENSDLLLQYAEEFAKHQKREKLDKDDVMLRLKLKNCESDSDSQNDELVQLQVPEKEKWDCESILSTYSNIYNHPKLITEPSIQKIKLNKQGIPVNVLGANKLTSKALSQLDEEYNAERGNAKSIGANSIISTLSTLSIRPKDESADDRKERKRLLKEYRKERRVEKKTNTEAFKAESIRQAKVAINNKKNVQGNKLL